MRAGAPDRTGAAAIQYKKSAVALQQRFHFKLISAEYTFRYLYRKYDSIAKIDHKKMDISTHVYIFS